MIDESPEIAKEKIKHLDAAIEVLERYDALSDETDTDSIEVLDTTGGYNSHKSYIIPRIIDGLQGRIEELIQNLDPDGGRSK